MKKLIYVLFLLILCSSCKNTAKQVSSGESIDNQELVDGDTIQIENEEDDTSDDESFIDENAGYPFTKESKEYRKIQKGKYILKSTDSKYISLTDKIIESHEIRDTSFFAKEGSMYIANQKSIALFKNRKPKGKEDVTGILQNGSFAIVDTIFYDGIYCDSDKAPMTFETWYKLLENAELGAYPLTYQVWYAVRINGKKYYLDLQLHDVIEAFKYIPQKQQYFVLASQSTGYDGMYDRGYPDYYEALVFQKPQDGSSVWKQTYRSKRLDLNNGGSDEYGLSEVVAFGGLFVDTKGDLVLNIENSYRLTWDGKSLSVVYDKDYLKEQNN